MIDPRFLVVRFAPGAAGKFLCTLLMSSPDIAHFDAGVEEHKDEQSQLEYAKRHFRSDLGNWLKFEPQNISAWNLHFVSTQYPRGNDLSRQRFLELCEQEATAHFHDSVSKQKLITTVWHKQLVPEFYLDAQFVNILVDRSAHKWFHRALWSKHYGVVNGRIHCKTHDARYHPSMSAYHAVYDNPVFLDEPVKPFIRREIVMNPAKLLFSDPENFAHETARQTFVNLSSILDQDRCVAAMRKIFEFLEVQPADDGTVRTLHQYWRSCHAF